MLEAVTASLSETRAPCCGNGKLRPQQLEEGLKLVYKRQKLICMADRYCMIACQSACALTS